MKQIYRKLRTRAPDLIRTEICDQAERIILPKLCNGVTFYEILSIYVKGNGNEIYYNYSDIKQDPREIINYFNSHPEELIIEFEEFNKIKKKIRDNLEIEKNPEELYNLLIEYWGHLCISMVFANFKELVNNKEFSEEAYQNRASDDKIIYDVLDKIYLIVNASLPECLIPYSRFLKFEEIKNKNFPKIEELKLRSQRYIFFKGELFTKENLMEVEEKLDIEILEKRRDNYLEIKGSPASLGKVKGRAKIIMELNQLSKLEEGDILVTPMTTPDFLPHIGKAKGIITDEGGITCHASIISREFSIPCIVGTEIATSYLKDNDLIELDADKGEIRILSKN